MAALTPEQLLDVATGYAHKWQPRLGLGRWEISVSVGTTAQHTAAETHWSNESLYARIVVRPDFFSEHDSRLWNKPDLEQTMIHELLHVYLAEVVGEAQDALWRTVGQGTVYNTMIESLRVCAERSCEQLSISLLRWERSGPDRHQCVSLQAPSEASCAPRSTPACH